VTVASGESQEDVEHRWAKGRKCLGIGWHIGYSISTMDIHLSSVGNMVDEKR
jgi:hypothetical protein